MFHISRDLSATEQNERQLDVQKHFSMLGNVGLPRYTSCGNSTAHIILVHALCRDCIDICKPYRSLHERKACVGTLKLKHKHVQSCEITAKRLFRRDASSI